MLKQLRGIDEKKFYLEEDKGIVYEIIPDGNLKRLHFGSIRIKRSKKNNEIKMISYSVRNYTYQLGEEGVVCEHSGTYRFWVKDDKQAFEIYTKYMEERIERLEEQTSILKRNLRRTTTLWPVCEDNSKT